MQSPIRKSDFVAAFLDQTSSATLAAIIGSAALAHADHPASRSIRGTSRQPMTSTPLRE